LPGICLLLTGWLASGAAALPNTRPLTPENDRSAIMVAGIDRFLDRETSRSVTSRAAFWKRNMSSPAAHSSSVEANRERLRRIIGAVDTRKPPGSLDFEAGASRPAKLVEASKFDAYTARWEVYEGVHGEGLLLAPHTEPDFRVVAVPDAGQTPEMLAGLAPGLPDERQWARRLAQNGCQVLILALVDRRDTWSGNAALNRFTNQPHREWIYRQAFLMGRHVIGYEVQKVMAAVDLLESENTRSGKRLKIGVAGYAEGGLIALYAAALDTRIDSALVSGYFDARERLWREPIYRNLFGLLREFGDAEIATLIVPRALVVEHSPVPEIAGPPPAREGRSGAAPGKLRTPDYTSVEAEFERARDLIKARDREAFDTVKLISGTEGMETGPGSDRALNAFLAGFGAPERDIDPPLPSPPYSRPAAEVIERQRRQVWELEEFTQALFRQSERVREAFFWNQAGNETADTWDKARAGFRNEFWENVMGRLPSPALPPNPRSRPLGGDSPMGDGPAAKAATPRKWSAYEVVLDVYPDVFAWGYLLVPHGLGRDERRPVVVCQHGLEGVPGDVVNQSTNHPSYHYYKGFAGQLADRGYVVFAPHNPYRGGDRFRLLQRKANPLGKSLFSVIIAQHERILDWLSTLPFVDARRIGFYGLSYGGKTAMRVPAVLDRYALSICSGDFNEWVRKNLSVDFPASYMFTGEYEMPEFNLGGTFNYAEMAALIAPRPFMVERGHSDGVGIDEWVAYEYAKVRRFYDHLGISDRTEIEFFNGAHTINGAGTFEFLSRHLRWPEPPAK
jgi:dienelactone hydrolase